MPAEQLSVWTFLCETPPTLQRVVLPFSINSQAANGTGSVSCTHIRICTGNHAHISAVTSLS